MHEFESMLSRKHCTIEQVHVVMETLNNTDTLHETVGY